MNLRLLFVVAVAQALGALFVVVSFPPVMAQFFVHKPVVVNGTLTNRAGTDLAMSVSLQAPVMVCVVLVVSFVSFTARISDGEDSEAVVSGDAPYSCEVLTSVGTWDPMFWLLVAGVHFVAFACACTPVDLFGGLFASYLCTHYLSRMCAPADPTRGVGFVNFDLLGYAGGVSVAAWTIPDAYTSRFSLLFGLVALDYFLCVGHTWDREPSFRTVANSRAFWACCAGLCMAAVYGVWSDDFMRPRVSA